MSAILRPTLPFFEDVEKWSVEQVSAWLQQRELPEVSDICLRKGLDGHHILNTPEINLVALFSNISIRKRTDILNTINEIRTQPRLPQNKCLAEKLRSASQSVKKQQNYLSSQKRDDSQNGVAYIYGIREGEVELKDVPFIDDSPDGSEDYLVPLSTGVTGVQSQKAPPRIKKTRFPSPSPKKECLSVSSPKQLQIQLSSSGATVYANEESVNQHRLPDQDTKKVDRKGSAPLVPPRTHSKLQKSAKSYTIPKKTLTKSFPPSLSTPNESLHKPSSSPKHSNLYSNSRFSESVQLQNKNVSAPERSNLTNDSLVLPDTLQLGNGKSIPMNGLYRSLLNCDYFHPVVRNVLSTLLTKDRMFLIRPSTHSKHPLTLSILEKGKIFNISIRQRSDGKYALGSDKPGEMYFSNIVDIIEHHRREAIRLEDGSLTYLKWTPSKILD